MPWDPDCYHRFERERKAPVDDLIALLRERIPPTSPTHPLHLIDLGCGTGEITRRLADDLPTVEVVGIDSSAEMLARAPVHPRVRYEQAAIVAASGQWDVVFSNAALHWVEDHERLIPHLFGLVAPNGQLAVQVPSNHHHATQTLLVEVAREFAGPLGGFSRRSPVLPVGVYAELLHAHGAVDIVAFEKVYPHVLPDADALVDWMRGTTMVPYLDRLSPPTREAFLARYRERIAARYPERPVFFGFHRTLFLASRRAA